MHDPWQNDPDRSTRRETPAGRTFGQPGGNWLHYELSLTRGLYVVTNEGGNELAAFDYEGHARLFCEDRTS